MQVVNLTQKRLLVTFVRPAANSVFDINNIPMVENCLQDSV